MEDQRANLETPIAATRWVIERTLPHKSEAVRLGFVGHRKYWFPIDQNKSVEFADEESAKAVASYVLNNPQDGWTVKQVF